MGESVDIEKLERSVKSVYRGVAERPNEDYHFEMGRDLAERLGYPAADLDWIPEPALESFAGVGYHFDYAGLAEGDVVYDLGSGSGTDVFVAARHVGETGRATGLDMTTEQLRKARSLRDSEGIQTVTFERGFIEDPPFDDESADVVISNGVINLSAQKETVFREVNRVLRSGGRLAVSDIVSEKPMPASIKSNADLWAACIGGAMQIDEYFELIESCGFGLESNRENPEYQFVSEQAADACEKYGVKSISFLAKKT